MLRKKELLVVLMLGLALCLIALVSAMPAQALSNASFGTLHQTSTPGPTGPCAGVQFALSFVATGDTIDTGGGFDMYRIEVTDGNGNLIAQTSSVIPLGVSSPSVNVSMSSATALPLTARLWDLDALSNKIGPPKWVQVVDPSTTYVVCASLPYVTPVTGGNSACAVDGRINSDDCAGPVALYCDGDELQVYDIDPETGIGALAFTFSGWPADAPAVNTLLASR